jgi:AcrR family transcriptional regulator
MNKTLETRPSAKPTAPAKPRRQAARKRPAPARDAAKTRARILQAATVEFSAKGYSGGRTEQIARRAKSNIRMLYHYYGSKDGLYLGVLEEVLGQLRQHELEWDFSHVAPLDGIVQMFDLIDDHFSAHPELRNLLAFENLNKAAHLKRSARIPEMSSPVLALIGSLLQRGEKDGAFRAGIDPLHLYVAMVSLSYYAKSHAHTLSRIFERDLLAPEWQRAHTAQTHQMLIAYLAPLPLPRKKQ